MSNNLDSAGLWWESRHNEIQDFAVPEPVEPAPSFVNLEEEPEVQTTVTNTEVRTELNMIKLNEPVAEIVVGLMNSLIPVIILLILKGVDEKELKLSSEEHNVLIQAWAMYLKDSNIEMSPGMILLVTIGSVYGAKVTKVLTDRKRLEQENNLIASQVQQIELLSKEILELKKKQNAA